MAGTVLLEVDFQVWVLEHAHDPGVVAHARQLRERCRAQDTDVFCLRYLDPEPGDRSDPLSQQAAFLPELTPQAGDLVLSKHDRDAFSNPDLHTNLALRGVDHVIIDGLLTEHGVQLAVASALQLGYAVSVAAAACAGANQAAHDQALRTMTAAGAHII